MHRAGRAQATRDAHSYGFGKLTFALFEFGLGQPPLQGGNFGQKFSHAHTEQIVVSRDANARLAGEAPLTGDAHCRFPVASVLRRRRKTEMKSSWWETPKYDAYDSARAKYDAHFVPRVAGNGKRF